MHPSQASHTSTAAPGYWAPLGDQAAASLDEIASMAARWLHAPVAVVWLADDHPGWLRRWFGAAAGWSQSDLAILAEALAGDRPEAVVDAAADPRFLYSVLVSGPRRLRFCASAPLIDAEGNHLGVLMAAAGAPRQVRPERLEGLAGLARLAALAIRQWEAAGAAAESSFGDEAGGGRWESMLEHAGDFVYTHDLRGRLTSVNRAAEELTGYRREELLAMNFGELVAPDHRETVSQMLLAQYGGGPAGVVELALRTRDGATVAVEAHAYLLFERGLPVGELGFIRPVRRPPDPRSHDAVSGLPNARGLTRRLQSELQACRWRRAPLAAILIEVTGLRLVNQALGYEAGDVLIEALARRFSDCLSENQWLGRLGGNRFVVVWSGAADAAAAESLALRLLEQTAPPFPWESNDLFVNASIGVSRFPADGDDALTLIRRAEKALRRAGARGSGALGFYSPDLPGGATERLEMATSLHRAHDSGQLRQIYQPQSDALGRLTGFEALLAWDHPALGRLAAREFIPVAEECGLMARFDAWMLAEACRRRRRWQRPGAPRARIAVNVSAAEFARPDFVDLVLQALAASGLDPRLLEMEITESVLMRDFEESALRIDSLRAIGVALAIDDFGTGYSSLSYLRRLHVDAVKIDKSFVDEIDRPTGSQGLVESIIGMVHGLGLIVVAEGVETAQQWEALRLAGCDRMQGHFLSAPIEEEAAERLLADARPFAVG